MCRTGVRDLDHMQRTILSERMQDLFGDDAAKRLTYPAREKKHLDVRTLFITHRSCSIRCIPVNAFGRVARQHKIHNAILAAHSINSAAC